MTNRFMYIVLLLSALLGACGGGVNLDEEQKKKLNDKAKEEMNSTIDKWLTSLGQDVPQDQCKAGSICTGTDGQAIECPDKCVDSCNGTCNKPSRKKKFEISITADVGGKLGQISASFTTNIDLETLDHKKATHNHKTVSDKKGKDPGKWVNWYMTFRGKVEILGDVKVTTQTGQTITVKLTFVDDNYDFSRCGFADCGGECGPTPSPTPSPTQSPTPPPASPTPAPTGSPTPPPASPTPAPTGSPTPPPASPTPAPTGSPTPPPASPTPMASISPTPWPSSASPTPMASISPTPWPSYSPTPWPTYSPTPWPTATATAAAAF